MAKRSTQGVVAVFEAVKSQYVAKPLAGVQVDRNQHGFAVKHLAFQVLANSAFGSTRNLCASEEWQFPKIVPVDLDPRSFQQERFRRGKNLNYTVRTWPFGPTRTF